MSVSGASADVAADAGAGNAATVPATSVARVRARFEAAAWPDADLVNASFALPFCGPEHFRALWERVVASLRPGARFCGQLFGDRDEWASAHAEMTFHTREEVERLLSDLDVERLDEVEEDGSTAFEPVKHWHVFHVVARRPQTGGG